MDNCIFRQTRTKLNVQVNKNKKYSIRKYSLEKRCSKACRL